ncbi:MAG: helix-turn-helix domain-containing protein [Myxococcota bacterium]|nr:helix-turn-helix domain-containing protein [Myxococcota bacterium]
MTQTDRLQSQAIGSYLKHQRTLRQISIEELAGLIRVPVRSLERLEAGCFDGQVDGFVKGFVRTVAEGLGMDSDDTLSRMLSEPEWERDPGVSIRRRLTRVGAGVIALGMLLVLAVVLYRVSVREELSPVESEREIVFRRDPVRALAAAQNAALPSVPGAHRSLEAGAEQGPSD